MFDNRSRNSSNRSLNNGDSSAPAFDSDSFMEHFENTTIEQTQTQTKLQESEQISAELIKKDEMLAQKKKVSFDNCNKFANFADYIEQNGVMGTSVDKLAEIRTQDSATFVLKSYGKNISDVYDKLVNTPYMDYKKSCNLDNVGGIFEDASPTSEFASVQ